MVFMAEEEVMLATTCIVHKGSPYSYVQKIE